MYQSMMQHFEMMTKMILSTWSKELASALAEIEFESIRHGNTWCETQPIGSITQMTNTFIGMAMDHCIVCGS